MKGVVDSKGRALLAIQVRANPDADSAAINVWVDTAFTGDLVLPMSQIARLGLQPSAIVPTILADGTRSTIDSFVAWIDWFGELQEVEVCASNGQNILLGVRLMLGRRLIVDYAEMTLSLE